MPQRPPDHANLTRVLSHLSHGGHALAEDLYKAEPAAAALETLSPLPEVVNDPTAAAVTDDGSTPFGYMLADARDVYPAAHLPVTDAAAVVAALKAVGAAMVDGDPTVVNGEQPDVNNATVPPVYTYWGQFIDHDITANTDRDTSVGITAKDLTPLPPDEVVTVLRNLREPALNLDSLYGDGPTAPVTPESVPYQPDGMRFELGVLSPPPPFPQQKIPPVADTHRDLPRTSTSTARVGDGRNDENLVIAQLHVAFLRFHNEVVTWVEANEPQLTTAGQKFARARQLVEWHYQWLVVHDFLQVVAAPGVADTVLAASEPGSPNRADLLFRPRNGSTFMPLEFSVAAYRFGHSMVRAEYDYNVNFGRPSLTQDGDGRAPFELLFAFTGKADPPFFGSPTLPDNWPIEWERFTSAAPAFPDRFARRIDTHLAPPLRRLANEGNDAGLPRRIQDIVKRLAVRNLLRGYRLGIPTGQAAADAFGVPALTPAQVRGEADKDGTPVVAEERNQLLGDALADGGFLDATPLWFYVLREAELQEGGNALGQVGSRIVCETLIGQIRADDDSFLNAGGSWSPADGVKTGAGDEIRTIVDLIRFAGLPA